MHRDSLNWLKRPLLSDPYSPLRVVISVRSSADQISLWENGSVTDLNSLSILEVGLPEKGSQKRLLRLASASSMPGL
jgi:hypothetical protein